MTPPSASVQPNRHSPTLAALAPDERKIIVAHLLERAGLPATEDELDELVELYAHNRATADLLFGAEVEELIRG